MECPKCAEDSRVMTTVKVSGVVYRKRICKMCENIFYTKESECSSLEAQSELTNRYTMFRRYQRELKRMEKNYGKDKFSG